MRSLSSTIRPSQTRCGTSRQRKDRHFSRRLEGLGAATEDISRIPRACRRPLLDCGSRAPARRCLPDPHAIVERGPDYPEIRRRRRTRNGFPGEGLSFIDKPDFATSFVSTEELPRPADPFASRPGNQYPQERAWAGIPDPFSCGYFCLVCHMCSFGNCSGARE